MSMTWELVCHDTQQYLHIGQGSCETLAVFYSANPETMEMLKLFLRRTHGWPVVMMDREWRGDRHDHYTDFEKDTKCGRKQGDGPGNR